MTSDINRWSEREARQFAERTINETRTKEKRPLYRELPPAPEFPASALGPLEPAALAVQQMTQAPMAICAQSVLAATTLSVQAHRSVQLPADGPKPLTELFISVAESGERKTSVDRFALKPIHDVEREWQAAYENMHQDYQNARESWNAAREQLKRKHKADADGLSKALGDLGMEPKAPPLPMLVVSDPTAEALVMHLAENRPFAGVFSAEGGMLIGGAAFKDDVKMNTAGLFNSLWDGETIRRKRITTGSTFLPGRRCSTHLMLQPVVASELFGDDLLEGMGLIARMLIVAPDSTAGSRLYREPPENATQSLARYNERLASLLRRPPAMSAKIPDALEPPVMSLSNDAKACWIEFYNECERAMGAGGALHAIRPFAGKLAEHAGRLAAILNVYYDPDSMEVSSHTMVCGIQLARHYAAEMLRLSDGAKVPSYLRAAARLLSWWKEQQSPNIHLAMIYQRGPADLRTAKTARAAAETLEEHGWIEKLEAGIEIDGAPRKQAWRLLP